MSDLTESYHPKVKHPSFFYRELSAFQMINRSVSLTLGRVLGSMWFFYFCVGLDLAELPAVIKAHDPIAWVTYIAQTVIQLLALPLLQAYSNINQEHAEAKQAADHMALTSMHVVLDDVHHIVSELRADKIVNKGR